MKLRQPHRGIVFEPRYGPAYAVSQLPEYFIYRIPTKRVVQTGEYNVFRYSFVQIGEMAHHSTPAGKHQTFLGSIPSKKIMSLQKGSSRERDACLTTLPVHVLVFPKPDILDFRIGLQKIRQSRLKHFSCSNGFDIESGASWIFVLLFGPGRYLRRKCAKNLIGNRIRLKPDTGRNAECVRISQCFVEGCLRPLRDFPRILRMNGCIGAEYFTFEELGRAHAEA